MKALLPADGTVEFGDADQPHPADDEALIRVQAFSVNRGETFLLENRWPPGWRPDRGQAAEGIAGRRILLTGASGGVGHYFTELAANAGAEVTAITASPERGTRLADLGARAVLRAVTDAEGPFDLVLESVGAGSMAAGLDRLRPGGTLIWFGQASRQPVTISFFDLLYGATSATIQHFSYADSPVPYGDDLVVLLRLVATGRLNPEIGRIADWAETGTVLADLHDRRIRGNAVLTIGGSS